MENQLAFLITLYEEERSNLKILINNCLEDVEGPDYLLAHYHQKALFDVEKSIRTLSRLGDSHYDEKQFYLTFIDKLKEDIKTTGSEDRKKDLLEMLQVYQERFDKLTSPVSQEKSESNTGLLETTLSNLISKKVKSFKIIFNKSEGISIRLSARGKLIKIVSSSIKRGKLSDSELDFLQKLGFSLSSKNRLVIQVENKNEDTLAKLRFILLKLIFDVSYFRHPENENYIEF